MLTDYVNMEHMKNAIEALFNHLNLRLSQKSLSLGYILKYILP